MRCSAGRAGACRRRVPGKRVRHDNGDEVVEDDTEPARRRLGPPDPHSQTRSSRERCRGCATVAAMPSAPGRSTWPAIRARIRWVRSGGAAGPGRRNAGCRPAGHRSAGQCRSMVDDRFARGHACDARTSTHAGSTDGRRHRRRRRHRRQAARAPRAGAAGHATPERPSGKRRARRRGDAARATRQAIAGVDGDRRSGRRQRAAVRRRRHAARIADLAALIGSQAAVVGTVANAPMADAIARARQTVTPLHPFLRWDPVPSPALVPRKRYTEGESLRVLVIRSGVIQDPDDAGAHGQRTRPPMPRLPGRPSPTSDTAPPANATSPRRRSARCRPNCMACSTSRSERPRQASHTRMLGWALRENGTFQDLDRADIDDPPNRIPQPNVDIVHVGTPTTALKTLPLGVGEAPAPGQTVVHDVDELGLPYLPDPMARGLSIVFSEAGQDRALPFPFGVEGFTAGLPRRMARDRTVPAGAHRQRGARRPCQGAHGHLRATARRHPDLPPRQQPAQGPTRPDGRVAQSAAFRAQTTATSPKRPPTAGCGGCRLSKT